MRTVFYDLETTDSDSNTAAIVQIGAILDVDGEVKGTLDLKVKAWNGCSVSQGALDATGLTVDDIYSEERMNGDEAYWEFMRFCGFKRGQRVYPQNRIFRAGYNILAFDNAILDNAGKRAGDLYSYAKFHWPGIDVASIACDKFAKERNDFSCFKLGYVAEYAGVDTSGKLHDALFDVTVTRDLYYKLKEMA